jgi:predicted dehydrogenase
MKKENKINFLIVGCGSIGQRHIDNLLSLGQKNIKIYDTDCVLVKKISKKFNVEQLKTLDFKNINCTLICTPPSTHLSIAKKALTESSHIFIEKPLSNSLKDVNNIIKIAKKNSLNIFVGYVFRFDYGLQKIKKLLTQNIVGKIISFDAYEGWYLPNWRAWQDHTKSYTGSKQLGGGIILDGSHELNYILWLVGEIKQVFSYFTSIPSLKVKAEGIAEILLVSKSNSIGRIHLDFINPKYNRHCEILCEKGSIRWNFETKKIEVQKAGSSKFKTIKYGLDNNQIYVDEMKYIISCILGKRNNDLITFNDAKRTLEISLAIKKSGSTGRAVFV